MKIMVVIVVALMTVLSSPVIAQGYYPGIYSQQGQKSQTTGPSALLRRHLNRLIEFVGRDTPPTKKQLMMYLDEDIAPHFDFQRMARWSAAGSWRSMNSEQKLVLRAQLQEMFLTSLTRRLMSYGGQRFRVLPARNRSGNEVGVGVLIQNPQGYPAKLNFRFYKAEDGWKVFDVTANGNSAVVYYRQYFNQMKRKRPRAPAAYPPFR